VGDAVPDLGTMMLSILVALRELHSRSQEAVACDDVVSVFVVMCAIADVWDACGCKLRGFLEGSWGAEAGRDRS
jgi:hypothetical protein